MGARGNPTYRISAYIQRGHPSHTQNDSTLGFHGIKNDSASESKVKTIKRFKIFRIIKLWEITNIIYDFNVLEGDSNFTLLPPRSH